VSAEQEISSGERFAFGANWSEFLEKVDQFRIDAARASIAASLGRQDLTGVRFLDAGCGSGLFSLAAQLMGADVVSFDFDASSVGCAHELQRRFAAQTREWTIVQGSVLDEEFLAGLGLFDVVYSWGVLHHTGDMWRAFHLIDSTVAPGGQLFISIYNDQGLPSRGWTQVKRRYNAAGPVGRAALLRAAETYFGARSVARRVLQPAAPQPSRSRGMSRSTDLLDWVGGYPFQVAKPEEVFAFYRDRHYTLQHLVTCRGGHGCNEYVFVKDGTRATR